MSTNQLYVSSLYPDNGSKNIDVESSIKIVFSRALNKSTIIKNLIVIEDPTGAIENISDISSKPYSVIQGNIKCDDYTVEFIPKNELLSGTRHLIFIRKNIESIYGDILLQDKLYSFNTLVDEYEDVVGIGGVKINTPTINFPENNSILNKLNTVDFNIDANDYGVYLQISNTNDFGNIAFEYKSDVTVSSVYINTKLQDGGYFIRVKSFTSEWCEPLQVYLQHIGEFPVSIDDLYDSDDINIENEYEDIYSDIVNITIVPSTRIKNNISNILVEFDKMLNILDIQDINIAKIFDHALDEETYSDIEIDSYSVYHDTELEKTLLVLHLQ